MLAPANNGVNVELSPILAWTVSPGATGYDVYLKVGSSIVSFISTQQTSVAIPLTLTTLQAYTWQVVAKNASGSSASSYSPVFTFTTGTGATSPLFAVTVSHTGTVTAGQPRVPYTILITNVGTAATSGLATVTVSFSTGAALDSISGTGWTCDVSRGSCTRGDMLDVGTAYPPLTGYVNISAAAPSLIDVGAAVSGSGTGAGGDNPTDVLAASGAVLSIAVSHASAFATGQVGASYAIKVSNSALAATAGVVTVTEAVPAGLTLVSLAGAGWNCSGVTCIRSDALLGGASYPAITATLNVAVNAPGAVVNTATVSGGGAFPASASDPTAVQIIAALNSPGVTSLSPVTSVGSSQTFTVQFTHPAGVGNLTVMNVLINTALDGRQACYLAFVRQSNTLYLVNNAGDAGGPFAGSFVVNGSGSAANGQCSISGAGSTVVTSGNTVTLTLNVAFTSGFSGNKVIFVAAGDGALNNTGWQTMGVHGVPPMALVFPNAAEMRPASGSTSSAIISFTYQDVTSVENLQTAWALVNTALDGRGACYVAYYRPGNQVFLVPDGGDGSQALGIAIGGTGSVSNSQCSVTAVGSSVVESLNQLTLNLNVTFKGAFTGPKGVWMAVGTLGGQVSEWQALGAWRVP